MKGIVEYMRKEEWSPYAAGILLGFVVIFSLLLTGNLPGSSAAFENLAATVGRHVAAPNNIYFVPQEVRGTTIQPIYPAGFTWQVILLIGVFFGAMGSALAAGKFIGWRRSVPDVDRQWRAIFGPERWKRWVIAFIGGVVLEFAAGIAGGCTSGLAISGGVQLAPAAFIFVAGMFISGIPTAYLIYRRRF